MIPAKPQVGDVVVILLAPYETGVVERLDGERVVEVRVAAGHLVAVGPDDVRVVEARLPQVGARVLLPGEGRPRVGTVRSVEAHPARFGDDGAMTLEPRAVVSVELDGGLGVAVVADGDEPLALTVLSEPVHPSWCDRDHDGFSAVTGVVEVEHRARRGSFELLQADVFDPATGAVERDAPVVLTPEDEGWRADTPPLLAARLRAEAAPLLALADLLDDPETAR